MTSVKLVVFDWAGTTVDHGSMAPLEGFVRAFAAEGVAVTPAEARGPMGLEKVEHLRGILRMPAVAQRWRQARGHDWTEADVERLYQVFVHMQLAALDDHGDLVPGLLDCVEDLRRKGIRIGGTTGYFRTAAERVYAAARTRGYVPDCSVCAEDVPQGRPAPWMLFRIMEALRIWPPCAVVKVGDTVPDVEEGLAAGAWSIGVLRTGSEVGCTANEWTALAPAEQKQRLESARARLLAAGAHATIETLAELPALLADIHGRLSRGEKP
jgi:phosphonoacetaldehyde hydrolase